MKRVRRLGCVSLVTDPLRVHGVLEDRVLEAVDAGVTMVQLRDKQASTRELYLQALRLRERLAGKALFLLNERVDVAVAVGADGVHLPEQGLPVRCAREQLGEDALIGCSVHSLEAALDAAAQGADYLQIGTIFPTDCKPGHPGDGVRLLREIRAACTLPLIAIGGINVHTIPDVVRTGVQGVAVVSAILQADTPAQATRELLAAWESEKAVM